MAMPASQSHPPPQQTHSPPPSPSPPPPPSPVEPVGNSNQRNQPPSPRLSSPPPPPPLHEDSNLIGNPNPDLRQPQSDSVSLSSPPAPSHGPDQSSLLPSPQPKENDDSNPNSTILPQSPSPENIDQDHNQNLSAEQQIAESKPDRNSSIILQPSSPENREEKQNPNADHGSAELDTTEHKLVVLQALPAVASLANKSLPWTHEETTNLIEAYQEKSYSLKRGQLKASQWEEVMITVAARCGYDKPTKTATQCRHKIEKLRKRYRAESLKPRSKANSWSFFKLMDSLDRRPLPISAAPPAASEYRNSGNYSGTKKKKDNRDSELLADYKKSSKSRSINRIVHSETTSTNKLGLNQNLGVPKALRTPMIRKRKGFFEKNYHEGDEEGDKIEEEQPEGVNGGGAELAMAVRAFAERFVKMEKKKMEMMRDTERYRMEMENKRMEMILEAQQKLAEAVRRALGGSSQKKLKLPAKKF